MSTDSLVATFAALGEPTRWAVLEALGEGDASASALASRMPVSHAESLKAGVRHAVP